MSFATISCAVCGLAFRVELKGHYCPVFENSEGIPVHYSFVVVYCDHCKVLSLWATAPPRRNNSIYQIDYAAQLSPQQMAYCLAAVQHNPALIVPVRSLPANYALMNSHC